MNLVESLKSKGVKGWIIQRGASTWYGPYDTREQAENALTHKDEFGDPVTGRVKSVGL